MKRLAWLAAWAGVSLGLTSCADEVDSVYANFHASFNFSPVTAVVPLNTAVNNAGEFCRVWKQSDSYYFDNAAGQSQDYPILATDAYTTWQALSGFIVGTTNIPDIGTGQLTLVAYDLACPNCFTESTITRRLDFDGGGAVRCGRCRRTYDLNNFGVVSSSEGGRSLFRYRVYFASNRLVVQN